MPPCQSTCLPRLSKLHSQRLPITSWWAGLFSALFVMHFSTAFEPWPHGNSPLLVFHCSEWVSSSDGFCFSYHIRLLFKDLSPTFLFFLIQLHDFSHMADAKNICKGFVFRKDLLLLVLFCISYWKLIISTLFSSPSHTFHFPTYSTIVEERMERLGKAKAVNEYRGGSPRHSREVLTKTQNNYDNINKSVQTQPKPNVIVLIFSFLCLSLKFLNVLHLPPNV